MELFLFFFLRFGHSKEDFFALALLIDDEEFNIPFVVGSLIVVDIVFVAVEIEGKGIVFVVVIEGHDLGPFAGFYHSRRLIVKLRLLRYIFEGTGYAEAAVCIGCDFADIAFCLQILHGFRSVFHRISVFVEEGVAVGVEFSIEIAVIGVGLFFATNEIVFIIGLGFRHPP